MKGNDYYSKNMLASCKYLNAYNTGNSGGVIYKTLQSSCKEILRIVEKHVTTAVIWVMQ